MPTFVLGFLSVQNKAVFCVCVSLPCKKADGGESPIFDPNCFSCSRSVVFGCNEAADHEP